MILQTRIVFFDSPSTCGDVAEWLRRSVSNLVGSPRVGSNSFSDTTNYKPAVLSAVHFLRSVDEYSEATLRAQTVVLQAHMSYIAAIYLGYMKN